MPTRKLLLFSGLWTLVFGIGAALAQGPNLGRPISQADIAAWDIDIEPDGAGLPAGSGTAAQGAPIFEEQCSACHGEGGKGATTTKSGAPAAPPVVSDIKRKGIDDTTLSIANYWPYATTLFDYIRRSMPWTTPRSLTDDQVYALTAYILAQNKLIDGQQVIDAQTLPKVQMPKRNGFIPRFSERMPPK
jgi:S-disulfanyl-L-cysteine oxidoreductase SoxD